MGKLIYHFGAMNAGKSAKLLQMAYVLNGKKPIAVYTAQTGCDSVTSRLGIERPCEYIEALFEPTGHRVEPEYIFIDECQWLSLQHVRQLRLLADSYNVEIHCFGLRSDYLGVMFEASHELFLLADEFYSLQTFCDHCDCSAILHNKERGKLDRNKDAYNSVCMAHFKGVNTHE